MGERVRQTKKTLWMRYVNFEKIKDILHLVNKNDGKLRAGELERLAIEQQIFIKEDGKSFSHSSRYHYRKVMENLDLLSLQNRVYHISQNSMSQSLLRKTEFKKPMPLEAQEIIRKIIIENKDCRKYFFDIFMGNSSYDIEDLRKKGKWIKVETKGKKGITLSNPHTRQRVFLNESDRIHAIFWGIRLWALDLRITDEIFISYREGRFIYPINTYQPSEALINVIIEKVRKDKKDSEWVMLHIPSFIKEIVLSMSMRLPIEEVKKVLWKLRMEHPSMIMLIPSSTSFIDIRTPFAKQDSVLLKPYIIDKEGRYISHIKISKDIVDILQGGA